ncbi:MAG: lipoyl(octanoyl) transferase LipB [Oxalobacter sp.]|nr:lipoyl(octanoyl) transferase LipB [Oxalobacter sp.]
MDAVIIRQLGIAPYSVTFDQMRHFTLTRTEDTPDEIWFVEHPPVFTLGKSANRSNILDAGNIPTIKTDRGGDVTYHGPGQAVVYLLWDLVRRFGRLRVRELVTQIEEAVLEVLSEHQIKGERHAGTPGIYIPARQGAKIAALGLKVNHKGYSYHGFALNVAMDLAPFTQINPCGYPGLTVTDMKTLGASCQVVDIQSALVKALASKIGFSVKGTLP